MPTLVFVLVETVRSSRENTTFHCLYSGFCHAYSNRSWPSVPEIRWLHQRGCCWSDFFHSHPVRMSHVRFARESRPTGWTRPHALLFEGSKSVPNTDTRIASTADWTMEEQNSLERYIATSFSSAYWLRLRRICLQVISVVKHRIRIINSNGSIHRRFRFRHHLRFVLIKNWIWWFGRPF